MTLQKSNTQLIALLRGINVGGHHKISMKMLREEMENLGFLKVTTLLNTGNIIFETQEMANLETKIEAHLQKVFGFPVPVLLRDSEEIVTLVKSSPFEKVEVTEDTRLYVSFLKNHPKIELSLPYLSKDASFQIIAIKNKTIFSVLDLSKGKSVKGMDDLERIFGKEITTRNWNTIIKLTK